MEPRNPASLATAEAVGQPRARGPLMLLVSGAACLVLAAASLVFAMLNADLGIHSWPRSEALPVDGHLHTFRLPEHETTMVWVYEAESAPSCNFTDAKTSEPLRLRSSEKEYFRAAGSGGGYRGTRVINSGSGQVTARCSGDAANLPVYLERSPRLPTLVDDLGVPGLIALGLALTGALVIVLALITRTRRSRAPSLE